jgi:hypothetical protein
MEYAALTFWLVVIVFAALAVHRLWCALVPPKAVNILLLPGTLVAQLGHVIGLLITGGTVNDTSLVNDGDSAEPKTGQDTQTRIPVVGTVIVALLPLAGCAAAIYCSSRYLGTAILSSKAMPTKPTDPLAIPTTVGAVFTLLHDAVNLVKGVVSAIRGCDLTNWRTALFLYLSVCLTVRMAPLTGNIRGSIIAILLTGLLTFLAAQIVRSPGLLAGVWPLITFSAAMLLLLLLVTLLSTAVVNLVRIVAGKG